MDVETVVDGEESSDPKGDTSSSSSLSNLSFNNTNAKQKFTLNFSTNNLKPIVDISLPTQEDTPMTDNLLEIAPKTTLLGIQQAKRRLHAFSLMRHKIPDSPLKKKNIKIPKVVVQTEEVYNEHGVKLEEKVLVKKPPKKCADKKSKTVIEEIEEMKKIENAYKEALEYDSKERIKRSESREEESRKKSDYKHHKKYLRQSSNRRSRSVTPEKIECPTSWAEFKRKQFDFDSLKNVTPKTIVEQKKNCFDFRKQLLFGPDPVFLNSLKVNTTKNQDALVPPEYIRFSSTSPTISYSENHTKIKPRYLTRKEIFKFTPKAYEDSCLKIMNSTHQRHETDVKSKTKSKKWFSKIPFNNLKGVTECEILELSLGLSFLKNYSDQEEEEIEETENKPQDTEKLIKEEIKPKIIESVKEKAEEKVTKDRRKEKKKVKRKKEKKKKIKTKKTKRRYSEEDIRDNLDKKKFGAKEEIEKDQKSNKTSGTGKSKKHDEKIKDISKPVFEQKSSKLREELKEPAPKEKSYSLSEEPTKLTDKKHPELTEDIEEKNSTSETKQRKSAKRKYSRWSEEIPPIPSKEEEKPLALNEEIPIKPSEENKTNFKDVVNKLEKKTSCWSLEKPLKSSEEEKSSLEDANKLEKTSSRWSEEKLLKSSSERKSNFELEKLVEVKIKHEEKSTKSKSKEKGEDTSLKIIEETKISKSKHEEKLSKPDKIKSSRWGEEIKSSQSNEEKLKSKGSKDPEYKEEKLSEDNRVKDKSKKENDFLLKDTISFVSSKHESSEEKPKFKGPKDPEHREERNFQDNRAKDRSKKENDAPRKRSRTNSQDFLVKDTISVTSSKHEDRNEQEKPKDKKTEKCSRKEETPDKITRNTDGREEKSVVDNKTIDRSKKVENYIPRRRFRTNSQDFLVKDTISVTSSKQHDKNEHEKRKDKEKVLEKFPKKEETFGKTTKHPEHKEGKNIDSSRAKDRLKNEDNNVPKRRSRTDSQDFLVKDTASVISSNHEDKSEREKLKDKEKNEKFSKKEENFVKTLKNPEQKEHKNIDDSRAKDRLKEENYIVRRKSRFDSQDFLSKDTVSITSSRHEDKKEHEKSNDKEKNEKFSKKEGTFDKTLKNPEHKEQKNIEDSRAKDRLKTEENDILRRRSRTDSQDVLVKDTVSFTSSKREYKNEREKPKDKEKNEKLSKKEETFDKTSKNPEQKSVEDGRPKDRLKKEENDILRRSRADAQDFLVKDTVSITSSKHEDKNEHEKPKPLKNPEHKEQKNIEDSRAKDRLKKEENDILRRRSRTDSQDFSVKDTVFVTSSKHEDRYEHERSRVKENNEKLSKKEETPSKTTKKNDKESNTPDTDEYHSLWESDEDLGIEDRRSRGSSYKPNRSWESDEEIFERPNYSRKSSPVKHDERRRNSSDKKRSDRFEERCLEMPLNIKNFHRDSRWENSSSDGRYKNYSDVFSLSPLYSLEGWEKDEVRKLEEERKTLTEQRRLLEIERKKLEEMERMRFFKNLHEFELEEGEKKKKKDVKKKNEEVNYNEFQLELNDKSRKTRRNEDDRRKSKEKELKKKETKKEVKSKDEISNKKNESAKKRKLDVAPEKKKLENEYEEFIKAVSTDVLSVDEKTPEKPVKKVDKVVKKRKRKVSTSSSSSSSDSSSSSTSSSSSSSSVSSTDSDERRKRRKKQFLKTKGHEVKKQKEELEVNKFDLSEKVSSSTLIETKNPDLVAKKQPDLVSKIQPDLEAKRQPDLVVKEVVIPLPVPSPNVVQLPVIQSDLLLPLEPALKIEVPKPIVGLKVPKDVEEISNKADSTCSPTKNLLHEELVDYALNSESVVQDMEICTPENSFEFGTMMIQPKKTPRLVSTSVNLDDDTEEKFRPELVTESTKNSEGTPLLDEKPEKEVVDKPEEEKEVRSLARTSSPYKERSGSSGSGSVGKLGRSDRKSPPRRWRTGSTSPRRRRDSPKRYRGAPPIRRGNISPRRSPRRDLSPRRHRMSSPRSRQRNRSRSRSPRRYRRRDDSPMLRREFSPRRKREYSPRISGRKIYSPEHISLLGGKHVGSKSPLHSPLDGFKRSLADSTISDDLLLQRNSENYLESPVYLVNQPRVVESPASPKRVPLDVRINQVLGIENIQSQSRTKLEETAHNFQGNYHGRYSEVYDSRQYQQNQRKMTKVVQVGNMLQIVPTEDAPPVPPAKPSDKAQKIVQVGNMLQIVPSEIPPPPPPLPVVPPVVEVEKLSVDALLIQKLAERREAKEKRKLERETKRKEKEVKKCEKDQKRQLRLQLKTEKSIQKALELETSELAEDNTDWTTVPIIISNSSLKPAGKGILISKGFSQFNLEGEDRRKSVKFADGVCPGEGTSPSGGEELSSPPPVKLPKEKRYKKTKALKKAKKKKVKVKVIRKAQPEPPEDDDDEDDSLPPPPPPPGSPPPHVFPPRYKMHTINNVHPILGSSQRSASAIFQQSPYRLPLTMPPPPPHGPPLTHHLPGPLGPLSLHHPPPPRPF